jgi:hypothetical protein
MPQRALRRAARSFPGIYPGLRRRAGRKPPRLTRYDWQESAEDWPRKAGAASFAGAKRRRVAPGQTAIRATQGVLIAASFEGGSLPPVPTPAFLRERAAERAHSLRASTAKFLALTPVSCRVVVPNCRYLLLLWLAFMTERGTRSHTLSLIAPGPKPCPAAPTSCPRGP